MPYPLENPKAKHDFLIYSQDDLSEDPKAVFDKLDSPLDPSQMKLISTIYSYPDGPRHPGPISRSVPVIGFVDSSSKIAQKLCSDPPMHKCTIAVKKFDSRLPDKDKQNTASFAKFVTKLGRTDTVAILGKDKYNRFGILKPMVEENDEEEKFAAECFVGDIETAKSLFPEANGTSAADADTGTNWGADTGTSDDGAGLWQPPGVNQEDIGGGTSSNDGLWQPPGAGQEDTGGSLWKPPGSDQNNEIFNFASSEADNTWQPSMTGITAAGIDTFQSGLKRNADEMENGGKKGETEFHKNAGAAAADDFYSNLTRELDTRSESKLYHMVSPILLLHCKNSSTGAYQALMLFFLIIEGFQWLGEGNANSRA